jgi:hypothetical protein
MPRNVTEKVLARQNSILEFISAEICASTKQIIETFDLTHSETFYALQQLRRRGLIEEYTLGKLSIWCISGHVINDVYVDNTLISIHDLEQAICEILKNARGHRATIRPSWVADIIAEHVHIKPRLPLLLSYISNMLQIVLSNVEKTVFKDSRNIEFYVVNTCSACNYFNECPACEKLKKKLNC